MQTVKFIFALAMTIGAALLTNAQAQAADHPHNVLLFVADGLRARIVNNQTAPVMASLRDKGVRFANSHSMGVCYSCHQLMDWIGFAFENYDGFGRHRTTDNNLPVVDTATIYNDPKGNNVNVTGLSGSGSLATYLAQSDDVNRCMMRYWSYYAYGSSSWAQDGCTYDAIYNEAQSNGFALKSVLMGILHAPNFTTRVQDQ